MGICLFIAVILSTFVVGVLCMFVDQNKIRLQSIININMDDKYDC